MRDWGAHLEIMSRLDPAELRSCFPELPSEHTLFWVNIYSACIILTDTIPEATTIDDVTHWHIIRGRAKTILKRHKVLLSRHTNRFEFRGRIHPILPCLIERDYMTEPTFLDLLHAENIDVSIAELHRRGYYKPTLQDCTDEQLATELATRPPSVALSALTMNDIAHYMAQAGRYQLVLSKLSEETKQEIMQSRDAAYRTTVVPQHPLDAYQDFTATTWSPPEKSNWLVVWEAAFEMISELEYHIRARNFDAVKKYAAYNKQPKNGMLVQKEVRSYDLHISDTGSSIPDSPEFSMPVCNMLHAMFGIITEVEELCSAISENSFEDKVTLSLIDPVNIKEECGDLLFYVARLLATFDISMSDCLIANRAKLEARFATGFSTTAATQRDLEAERAILEKSSELAAAAGVPIDQDCGVSQPLGVFTYTGEVQVGRENCCICKHTAPCPHYSGHNADGSLIPVFCNYCQVSGHLQQDCPVLVADKAEAAAEEVSTFTPEPDQTDRVLPDGNPF